MTGICSPVVPGTLAGLSYNLLPAGGQASKVPPALQKSPKALGVEGNLLNTGHSIYRSGTNFVSLIFQPQTHAAGFYLLFVTATYENSNPRSWKDTPS